MTKIPLNWLAEFGFSGRLVFCTYPSEQRYEYTEGGGGAQNSYTQSQPGLAGELMREMSNSFRAGMFI